MNQARVFRSKATKKLEEHIEHLQECLTDAVAEFDQRHHVPAGAIFNYIDDDTIAGSYGYAHMEDCDTILRWDWFPNPNAEPESVDEHELNDEENKAQKEGVDALLVWLKHRR